MREAREAKLPRWAQVELGRLRANLADLHRRMNAAAAGGDGSIQIEEEGDGNLLPMRPLATRRVQFVVDGARFEARVDVARGVIFSSWDGVLLVEPSASNVVILSKRDR